MTKAFLHGRTEAIRTVQPESVKFVKVCLIRWWVFGTEFALDVLLRYTQSISESRGVEGRM